MLMDSKGVSEPVGWVIGFGVLVIAAGMIFIIATPNILTTSDRISEEVGKVEMTVLDYTVSKVALGEIPSQYVRFNMLGGNIKAETGGNRVKVNIILSNGTKITVYNDSIGRVVFKKDYRKIGFEDGGVWMLDGNDSIMVSPPEFHFRIDTLTLPIIKISSNFSAGGYGTIAIPVSKKSTLVYYPNSTMNPNFVNPVTCRYVEFVIQSEFYKAWERYARERTSANVTVYDSNQTVVLLMTATYHGTKTPLSSLTTGIPLGKLNYTDTTPINTFVINLEGLTPDLNLPIYTDTGSYQLWISFKKTGGGSTVDYIVVAYVDNINGKYESWVTTQPIPYSGTNSSYINLLNASISMEYTDQLHGVSVPGVSGKTFSDPTWTWNNDTFVQESINPSIGEFSKGTTLSMSDVIQHYFRVLAIQTDQQIVLKKPSGSQYKGYSETNSWLLFDANLKSPYITYLHINEHSVDFGS